MSAPFHEPIALVILSSISIGLGGVTAGWIVLDSLLRRGWRSMFTIMIPVYVINALYLWPVTLRMYNRYGRPDKPSSSDGQAKQGGSEAIERDSDRVRKVSLGQQQHHDTSESTLNDEEAYKETNTSDNSARPFFATVTIGVCHCGAGCVLGDIIGEWLVYDIGATIGSNPPRQLWAQMLVGFGSSLRRHLSIFQHRGRV
ncbi:hypothetical protein PMZ80_002416 [Knufia obscura]|uniref:DUF4396 domain-containing protein n=2 Tax=Knufia TaxID=430999 RepID=A0AAN8ENC5_9EURO|nr:hypothetical protein PMZ80_002416 [Knufia obscura]KAK5948583.1 hypothetical protein OHC33_010342 [Knufia fluminis]